MKSIKARFAPWQAVPDTSDRTARLFWWWMIPVLLLAFALGAHGLNYDALWLDELRSIRDMGGANFGSRTLAGIWERVSQGTLVHPPGFYMFLQGWAQLVGVHPPILRAFPLFLGILTVAWLYRLGMVLVSRRVGLYSAAVLGTSVFFVQHLHELRMYVLLTFATVMFLWAYFRIIDTPNNPNRWHWVALFVGTVVAVYSHYYGFMALIALGLYHVIFVPKNRRWWQVVGGMLLAGLVYIPWVVVPLSILGEERLYDLQLPVTELVPQVVELVGNGYPLLLIGVGCFALTTMTRGARRIWFFAVAILMAIVVTMPILRVLNANRLRYLIQLWLPLALIVGIGITQIERYVSRYVAWIVLGLFVVTGIINWNSAALLGTQGGADTRAFPLETSAALAAQYAEPGDAVIVYLPDDTYSYRFEELAEFYFWESDVDYILTAYQRRDGMQADEVNRRYQKIEGEPRVWLVYMPNAEAAAFAEFETLLHDTFAQCPTTTEQNGLRVEQYAIVPACCLSAETETGGRVLFDNGIRLVDMNPVEATDDELTVTLLWSQDDSVPLHEYSASLQVHDPAGNKVAQVDYGLPPQRFVCQQTALALPLNDLSPADYHFGVTVYAWRTGERVPGLDTATGLHADLLPLDQFTIRAD
jgi:hypothetical protein